MSARLLAAFCLILAVSPGWTGSTDSSGPELVVYLKTAPSQPPGPLDAMKRELNSLMSSAGFRVEWRDKQSASRDVADAELIMVELRGACGLSARAAGEGSEAGSLASTAISDGRVLPFSWLNCDALTRLLAPALSGEEESRGDFLYGRAMARVLAHELYHVTGRTREHGHEGVSKPAFSRQDLLKEHFAFAGDALARVRHPSAGGW